MVELESDNRPRWQVDNLVFPLDAQVLPGDRSWSPSTMHVASPNATQGRDPLAKGHPGPLVAQRMPNGNTFIATESSSPGGDRDDKESSASAMPSGERIMKAMKLPNGEIAVLDRRGPHRPARPDGQGALATPSPWASAIWRPHLHAAQWPRAVPHNAENKVVEYDARGKAVWEVAVDQPIAAGAPCHSRRNRRRSPLHHVVQAAWAGLMLDYRWPGVVVFHDVRDTGIAEIKLFPGQRPDVQSPGQRPGERQTAKAPKGRDKPEQVRSHLAPFGPNSRLVAFPRVLAPGSTFNAVGVHTFQQIDEPSHPSPPACVRAIRSPAGRRRGWG